MAEQPSNATLFQNVRIFDGKNDLISAPSDVLVEGSRIARISATTPVSDLDRHVTFVAGGGRVLMPGLIDAHWHAMFATLPFVALTTADVGYANLAAGQAAEATLLRGFTAVRDVGGPVFGLKRAIDEGIVVGPRIYPSGAFISQTSGHGDFRMPYEVPRAVGDPLTYLERVGISAIADSPDEVRLRAREQLRQGASQLKLMAGGGVASQFDPIDATQYTEAEIRAAVEAAENWGTYVTVHAYTPHSIRNAVAAGVKCVEHGQLIDEPTAELLAQREVWLSLQPFLDDEDAIPLPDPEQRRKAGEVFAGTDTAYTLANRYGIRVAFGTDTLFDPRLAARQGAQLAKLVRWYPTAGVLKMATADNAELLALSGPRNPYPGKLGVVEEGALADLLLVDGDPLQDIRLLEDPATNLLVIMKDGRIFKNLLAA